MIWIVAVNFQVSKFKTIHTGSLVVPVEKRSSHMCDKFSEGKKCTLLRSHCEQDTWKFTRER